MNFTAPFIKTPAPFDKNASVSPIFRRKFTLEETENAFVNFSALGFGYLFINGKIVSEDLFLSPFSEYGKLVYYNRYEVSTHLRKGENVIAVILGFLSYQMRTRRQILLALIATVMALTL